MPAGITLPASMTSGVTKSGIATNLVPKIASDAAATGAASLGLGTLLSVLGPAYSIYSVLDALGFFDKGMEATPMTPEERAKFEAESRLALASSGLSGGGEGAYETLMDALSQASATENVSEQDIANILGQSGYITSLTGAPGGTTEPTLVEMTQEKINKAASAVGKAQDTLFDIFGIPKPDYSVIQPNAPGATVIWGEPSGGVFGRIGTTPGGTVTGVQTGIPALDVVLGRVADVVSGRAAAGEVLNTETIKEIILQTAGDELGIPGDPNQVLADIKEIGSKVFYDEDTGKLGIDLGDGAGGITDKVTTGGETPTLTTDKVTTGGETPTLSTDRATLGGETPTLSTDRTTLGDETPTLTTDRVTTTGGGLSTLTTDRVTPTLTTDRVTPTLTTDRVTPTLTTDRVTPTLTTDRVAPNLDEVITIITDRTGTIADPTITERVTPAGSSTTTDRADEVPGGGGGGVGLGETGGVRVVSGAPGPGVDIDYLYDFARGLDQPFITADEDEEDKYRPYIYAEGGPVKKFEDGGFLGLNPTQLGLLGTAVGGLFGGLSGSGDTQGSQGYTGGIPSLMAEREVVPNAFAMEGRRPGEAGRRYFTDVQYTPVTDATGAPTVLGGEQIAAQNAAALARQQELQDLGTSLLGLYGQNLASTAGTTPAGTTPTGTTPTGTTPTGTTPTGTTPAGTTTDTTGVDTAYNNFISQFSGTLTAEDAAKIANSGYSLNQLATSFGVDPTELRTFVSQQTGGTATLDDGITGRAGMANLLVSLGGTKNADGTVTDRFGTTYSWQNDAWRPVAGTTDTTTTDTAGGITTGIIGDGVANNTVTDENFGKIVDETGVYTSEGYKTIPYNNFVNQFMGRELTAEDAAALASSGYALSDLANSFGVDPDALLNFVNFYVNSGGTSGTGSTGGLESFYDDRPLTEAELKQAVLDGTMSYGDAYRQLGIADAVNPFGFTEEEQMALGISESQRTGQGYKYNPTTGSMDLYDYDTDTFVDETGTTGAGETLTLNAADGSTSTIDLTGGADSLTTTGTADPNAGPLAPTLDMVDASDGISKQEQDIIASIVSQGTAGVSDVAEEFGASDAEVIAGLIRGGYQTPAQIADRYEDLSEADLVGILLSENLTTPAEIAGYYGIPEDEVVAYARSNYGLDLAGGGYLNYAQGGMAQGRGYYLGGTTDGMADQIPATINNMEPARLSDGEFVIPADVVSHLGNGNSDAGAKNLYSMMERVRKDRTGNPKQGRQIDPNKYLA